MSALCHECLTWPIDASRGGVARWKGSLASQTLSPREGVACETSGKAGREIASVRVMV